MFCVFDYVLVVEFESRTWGSLYWWDSCELHNIIFNGLI